MKFDNFLKSGYYSIERLGIRLFQENSVQCHVLRKRYRPYLLKLRDIYKGKRCFIIGNGPSLTAKDLDLLKNEFTFASNRVFYIFNKTKWRPTFYGAQDWAVIDDIMPELPKIVKECKGMFLISNCYSHAPKELKDNKKVYFYRAKNVSAHKERLFSNRIENYISGGGSITYALIQIAAYMGFAEIYLIGVDHNYSTTSFSNNQMVDADVKANYFEGMPATLKVTKPNPDNSTLSFMKAKEYADANGIRIINVTRGGKLEVFPRMKLEDVLK